MQEIIKFIINLFSSPHWKVSENDWKVSENDWKVSENDCIEPKFKYGVTSLRRISECHQDLQIIAFELIKVMDVSVICGHRGELEQNKAFDGGFSRVRYPEGKHNKMPSLAIDIAPYPIDWKDLSRFETMCLEIEKISKEKGIKIRLGRDFKSLVDWPHVELVG
jgi:peptidoglycan LD-endopeptidase CwlK